MISRLSTSIRGFGVLIILIILSDCASGRAHLDTLFVVPTGQKIRYDYGFITVSDMELPGMGQMRTTQTAQFVYTIEGTGKTREFQISLDDAALTTLSSEPDRSDPRTHITDMSEHIGRVLAVKLDERGLVSSAMDLEGGELLSRIGGKETCQFFFLFMPEVPMKSGVEWTRASSDSTESVNMFGILNRDLTYRCVEETHYEGRPAWKVALSGKTTMHGVTTDIDMDTAGVIEGTIYAHRQTGLILGAEEKSTLTGNSSMMGMSIPISVTITTTVHIQH